MKNTTESQTKELGEQERDNDAHRPDGSTGTRHDSTAQKTARDQGPHSSEQASSKNDLGFDRTPPAWRTRKWIPKGRQNRPGIE